MLAHDYDRVYSLWKCTAGLGLSESDEREAIESFLLRNPGLSAVACADATIVGTVLGGHDGRRGYLHHLAVLPEYRKQGIARQLIDYCLDRLRNERILKCNVFLFRTNESGRDFWQHIDWKLRDDLALMQIRLR